MSQTGDSTVQIGPKPLGAVSKSEEDEVDEFLGFLTFSTTGEVHVPREWLQEQFQKNDIPMDIFPKKPSRWSAYRRAMQELLEETGFREYSVFNSEYARSFDCKLELEKSNEMGSNVFIVYANVFFPEEVIGEEGGDWRKNRLGYFDFHRPEEGPGGLVTYSDVDEDNVHFDKWQATSQRARELFQKMQDHHNFADLQKTLEGFRQKASAVEVRRAVYFVGAHHQDMVEGLSTLWEQMNRFKDGGEAMRIDSTPVVNLEEQRDLIASRARDMVEDMVDEIVDETIEEWKEEEERTADEAAREIMNELDDSESFAAEYNQLLQTKLSVKQILEDRMDEFADEQEKIIENVLDQQTFEEV